MKITSVESFDVEVPVTDEQLELGCCHRSGVTRIRTDEGLTGDGWSRVDAGAVNAAITRMGPPQSGHTHIACQTTSMTPPRERLDPSFDNRVCAWVRRPNSDQGARTWRAFI